MQNSIILITKFMHESKNVALKNKKKIFSSIEVLYKVEEDYKQTYSEV